MVQKVDLLCDGIQNKNFRFGLCILSYLMKRQNNQNVPGCIKVADTILTLAHIKLQLDKSSIWSDCSESINREIYIFKYDYRKALYKFKISLQFISQSIFMSKDII